jgi:hypothetical protein
MPRHSGRAAERQSGMRTAERQNGRAAERHENGRAAERLNGWTAERPADRQKFWNAPLIHLIRIYVRNCSWQRKWHDIIIFLVLYVSYRMHVAHITEVVIAHGTEKKRLLHRMSRCSYLRCSFPVKFALAAHGLPSIRRCSLFRGAHI